MQPTRPRLAFAAWTCALISNWALFASGLLWNRPTMISWAVVHLAASLCISLGFVVTSPRLPHLTRDASVVVWMAILGVLQANLLFLPYLISDLQRSPSCANHHYGRAEVAPGLAFLLFLFLGLGALASRALLNTWLHRAHVREAIRGTTILVGLGGLGLLGLHVDQGSPIPLPLDVVARALLLWLAARWRVEPRAVPSPPASLRITMDGWRFTDRPQTPVSVHWVAAGTLALGVPATLWPLAEPSLLPPRWPVPVPLIPLERTLLAAFLVYFLPARPASALAQVELTGRVLTVGKRSVTLDGRHLVALASTRDRLAIHSPGGTLQFRGSAPIVAWLLDELERFDEREDDVQAEAPDLSQLLHSIGGPHGRAWGARRAAVHPTSAEPE